MASKKFMPLQRSIKKRASRLAKRQIDTFFRNLDGECENTEMGYEIIGEQCENVGRVERSDLESYGNANQFMEGEDCSPLQSDFEGCSSPSATPSVPESDEDSIFGGNGSSDPVYQTEENSGERRELSLRTQLAQWSVDYGITLEATSALLKILKPLHPHLPKTAESLRLTKKRKVPVKKLDNGNYAHLGLINGIKEFSKVRELQDETVLFDISFDGFPIYKSASTECWPILARCNQLGIREPFPLGIFYGEGKPKPLTEYLSEFLEEVRDLKNDNAFAFGRQCQLKFRYICDAPARAYIRCIVGHNSIHGCERCEQEGESVGHFTIYSSVGGPLRTNNSFLNGEDFSHHKGDSPLKDIGTNFISDIPLDPMHLVDLGTLRRFLKYILFEGNVVARLSAANRRTLDANIEEVSPFLPCEFTRKVRSLHYFSKWKASECRQFLLYVGPVVLSSVLKANVFKCFLLLHSGIFIVSNEKLISSLVDDADEFLKLFVSYSAKILGSKFLSYNIHSLLHLCGDVKNHGPLARFSAYPFESKLGHIKKLVRSSHLPLQQIFKRLCEKQTFGNKSNDRRRRGVVGEHEEGPVPDGMDVTGQFHSYEDVHYILKDRHPDNCVYLNSGRYGLIRNIVTCNGGLLTGIRIVAQEFQSFSDLYVYPISSGKLGIYKVSNLSHETKAYELSDILYKAILMPYGEEHVAFPLLHSF